ncbi:MAG: folylpolyglutamate synthase/dihydrofolate synthase family protein [Pseudomonadota bacterium]
MTQGTSDVILERLMRLHPKIIDLTLDRMWRLLDAMGNPQDRLPPVVHIAGTNGKGSTLAMIRAGLEAEGLRVHAYTSPHLVRFHERIRLAGNLIPEPDLAEMLQDCEIANGGRPITFFEITTVAALAAFARVPADVTLLEVGLGGRLDATNVITPRLSVITPVSLDHQHYLGDTLAAIAGEKAGILKSAIPAVIGRQESTAQDVISARAAELGAPLHCHGQDWHIAPSGEGLRFEDSAGGLELPRPALPGAHQIENAGTAVSALRQLGLGDPAAALTEAEWPARLQRITRGALAKALPQGAELWLDGGHNPAAGQALAAHLAGRKGPLWLILGMIDTKAVEDFLAPLMPLAEGAFSVPVPDSEAGIPPAVLARRAHDIGLHCEPAEDAEEALTRIRAATSTPPVIVICGSLYLAGAVLRRWPAM